MHRIKYYLYHSEISNLLATIFKLQIKYLKFRYDSSPITISILRFLRPKINKSASSIPHYVNVLV